MAAAALIRLRLTDVPLERDEGEYAYAGQLILDGVPPYSLAFNMKFPGAYYAYAVLMAVFGETVWGIRVGILVVVATSTWLMFVVTRRLFDGRIGAIAAVIFATLTLDRWSMAFFGHATHFILPPLLGGISLLLRAADTGRMTTYVMAGAAFGAAVLMKQHAVFFLPLAAGLVLLRMHELSARERAVRGAALAAGAMLPVAAVLGVLAAQGVLDRFWFWTIRYSMEYVGEIKAGEGFELFRYGWALVTRSTVWIWVAAGLGLAVLFGRRYAGSRRLIVLAWAASAGLAIVPGLYFRPHYFILLFPVAAILAAVSIDRLAALTGARAGAAAAGMALALISTYVAGERGYLFSMSGESVSRQVYDVNPFVESPRIAEYLRSQTTPQDRIAVMGSEPQIYFLADRRSATGHIYTYPLMEPQPFARQMQRDMIQEIESARPAFLVIVMVPGSWAAQPTSDDRILEWMERYARDCYIPEGVVEISAGGAAWRWGADARMRSPATPQFVAIHRRTSAAPCRAGG
jgi:hypothetical protein